MFGVKLDSSEGNIKRMDKDMWLNGEGETFQDIVRKEWAEYTQSDEYLDELIELAEREVSDDAPIEG